jgi:hypothetical protein
MRHRVKEIIRAAGLRDELTFTSFRHGGFTEAADSDLTDAEMRAQGRYKSAKVLPRYAKRTVKQVAEGARKLSTDPSEPRPKETSSTAAVWWFSPSTASPLRSRGVTLLITATTIHRSNAIIGNQTH